MSEKNASAAEGSAAPKFTERELQLLGFAMQSLKSGPPEIDYDNLARLAGMGNPRSASNAWAKIKVKLMAPADGNGTPVSTPKRSTTTSKKKSTTAADTPKKTPGKRGAKKQDVDGEASPTPKKRGRPAKSQAIVKQEDLEEDDDEATPPAANGSMKEEVHEDEDEDEDENVEI